ncbi:hypothetical protein Cni_G18821 [Canna indica]|uniref:B box-type domain-containing protein n=1 Tax=Canna indica TaxID=4628 RepID=A0AAQ3KQ27_9LILI|nr:hypothetical protein Cni_G18821 [Canna indica]
MKIQCEVCAEEAAEVYCCADEAALCGSCDRRVHRANRVAGKHHRFSLLHPSSSSTAKSPPLCDVCKEKRGFLFCQEDRAILCRDCDVPIHSATALTMRHSRFLLTGVRLSAAPIPDAEAEADDNLHGESSVKTNSGGGSGYAATAATANSNSSGSSISEYLINMLPGWHVEDFLTDDATAHAFCKGEEIGPFYGINTSDSVMNGFGGALPVRVPHAPCWDSGGGGERIGLVEEVEMKGSSRTKRLRISARTISSYILNKMDKYRDIGIWSSKTKNYSSHKVDATTTGHVPSKN